MCHLYMKTRITFMASQCYLPFLNFSILIFRGTCHRWVTRNLSPTFLFHVLFKESCSVLQHFTTARSCTYKCVHTEEQYWPHHTVVYYTRCIQKVKTGHKTWPRGWCPHFLWRSVIFCKSSGTHILHGTVSEVHSPFPVVSKDEMKIDNSTNCEVQSVIWFSNAKNVCPVKIDTQIVDVCGEGTMKEGNVTKCSHLF
jgi:hypothetical protein